jgi:DNA polymerase III delta subunit
MDMLIQRFPIIHTTAFQIAISYGEAERTNQMQTNIRNRTETTNVARILGDLWIIEYDVKHRTNETVN